MSFFSEVGESESPPTTHHPSIARTWIRSWRVSNGEPRHVVVNLRFAPRDSPRRASLLQCQPTAATCSATALSHCKTAKISSPRI
jgi:hypothetical protein